MTKTPQDWPASKIYKRKLSTLIACEKLSRKARLVDLDEKYVDVIVKRWQNFTGGKAILAGTDKTYDQVVEERSDK